MILKRISLKLYISSGGCVTKDSSIKDNNKLNKSKISAELAIKIAVGDTNASNDFVQINYSWLLFIVRNKFSKSNNHEDIVQDTFMLVINKLQKGDVNNPQTILAYLRTTAIHIGFEYLRKDKKFTSAIGQDMLDVIEDAQHDILSTLIWDDKVTFVKQVINELKIQRDKDILNAFYFKEESKTNICSQLELSSEHFDRVLYRAKERLKQLITQKDNDSKNHFDVISNDKKPHKKSHNFMSKLIHSLKYNSWLLLSLLKNINTSNQEDLNDTI